MKLGTLGILLKDIFDINSSKFVDKNYAYLTVATTTNKTEEYNSYHPKIERTVFEVRWYLIEEKSDLPCMAMHLSESVVPDEVVSVGEDFKVSSIADNKWKYYKVLLSVNDKIEVVYLHEKSLNLFTWFCTEDTSFHVASPSSSLLSPQQPYHPFPHHSSS